MIIQSTKASSTLTFSLPFELLDQILFYYTNNFQGVIQFSQVCKDWKKVADSSYLWLSMDLFFYSPLDYFLLCVQLPLFNPSSSSSSSSSSRASSNLPLRDLMVFMGDHSPEYIPCFHEISILKSWKFKIVIERNNWSDTTISENEGLAVIAEGEGEGKRLLLKDEAYQTRQWFISLFLRYHRLWRWHIDCHPRYSRIYRITEEYLPKISFTFFLSCWIAFPLISIYFFRHFKREGGSGGGGGGGGSATGGSTNSSFGLSLSLQNRIGFLIIEFLLFFYLFLLVMHSLRIIASKVIHSQLTIQLDFYRSPALIKTINRVFLISGLLLSVLFLQFKFSQLLAGVNRIPYSVIFTPFIVANGCQFYFTSLSWKQASQQAMNNNTQSSLTAGGSIFPYNPLLIPNPPPISAEQQQQPHPQHHHPHQHEENNNSHLHANNPPPLPQLSTQKWIGYLLFPLSFSCSLFLLMLSIDLEMNSTILFLYSVLPFSILFIGVVYRTISCFKIWLKCFTVYYFDWILKILSSLYLMLTLTEMALGIFYLILLFSPSPSSSSGPSLSHGEAGGDVIFLRLSNGMKYLTQFLFFEFFFNYLEETLDTLASF